MQRKNQPVSAVEKYMKAELNYLFTLLWLLTATMHLLAAPAQSTAPQTTTDQEVTPAGDELTWPREFQGNGAKVDIYQPEIERVKQ